MSLKRQIEKAKGNAAQMERLYAAAAAEGNKSEFKSAVAASIANHPNDILYLAWAYRLGIESLPQEDGMAVQGEKAQQQRQWKIAIAVSILLGIVFAVFTQGKPPVPVPGEADPLFWLGWAPLAALAILHFLYVFARPGTKVHRFTGPAIAVVLIAACATIVAWSRTDHIAILISLHLPFVCWAAIGVGLCYGHREPGRHGYAFMVKSAEVVLTGGIYFGGCVVFMGLTYGIFAVLGVTIPEKLGIMAAAWCIGAVPVLAVASAYNPTVLPAEQNLRAGLARVLGTLTKLLTPLALAVLAVYVIWFIPTNFWRPFQEREVLIVYNATLIAIIVLLAIVTSGSKELSSGQTAVLYYAVLAISILTLLLNTYALTAIINRIIRFGLSPNRFTVLGWNAVTFAMLAVVTVKLLKHRTGQWIQSMQNSIGSMAVVAAAWALWVVLILPLSFINTYVHFAG